MGIADRDYHRESRREGGGIFSQMTPVVKWLLIINIGIYFVDLLLKGQAQDGPIRLFGDFTIHSAVLSGRVWEFLTFQFLHGSVGHLLFNCVGIFFFGPWLERWWGAQKFLIYYLFCGVGGAVFFTLLASLHLLPDVYLPIPMAKELGVIGSIIKGDSVLIPPSAISLIGASAGIYGILIGVAVLAPNLRVALFFPPIELTMRQLAITLLVISLGSILFKLGGNEGGEAGHLGGAIVGFILMRFPRVLGGEPGMKIIQPKIFTSPPAKLRPRSEIEKTQDTAVDVILDKISSQGFQSLTQQERDFLQRVADQKKSSP